MTWQRYFAPFDAASLRGWSGSKGAGRFGPAPQSCSASRLRRGANRGPCATRRNRLNQRAVAPTRQTRPQCGSRCSHARALGQSSRSLKQYVPVHAEIGQAKEYAGLRTSRKQRCPLLLRRHSRDRRPASAQAPVAPALSVPGAVAAQGHERRCSHRHGWLLRKGSAMVPAHFNLAKTSLRIFATTWTRGSTTSAMLNWTAVPNMTAASFGSSL